MSLSSPAPPSKKRVLSPLSSPRDDKSTSQAMPIKQKGRKEQKHHNKKEKKRTHQRRPGRRDDALLLLLRARRSKGRSSRRRNGSGSSSSLPDGVHVHVIVVVDGWRDGLRWSFEELRRRGENQKAQRACRSSFFFRRRRLEPSHREKEKKEVLFSLSTHRLGGLRARGEGRSHVVRGVVWPVVVKERVERWGRVLSF